MNKKYFLIIVLPAFFLFLFSLWQLWKVDYEPKIIKCVEKENSNKIGICKSSITLKKSDTVESNRGRYLQQR